MPDGAPGGTLPRRARRVPPGPAPPRRPRSAGWLALGLSVALVLAATLHPTASEGAGGWDGCVLCGSRGLADALLNVGLFVPLGVSLGWLGVGWRRGVVAAALLSAGVELAQLVVPGRDPSPPDLLFDALGTLVGLAAARWAPWRLAGAPARAGRLALGWSLLFAASLPAAGWLSAPSLARARVFAQWNPEIGGRPPYPGRLLSARAGSTELGPGPSPRADEVRRTLSGDAALRLRFAAAPAPPRAPSPLLRLAGAGDVGLAVVSVHGDDLLFGYRMRAADLRLDAPLHRFPGLLRGVRPGEPVEVALRREGRVVHASAASAAGAASARSAPGAGRGWALLWYAAEIPASAARLLDVLWLALWAAPLGLCLHADRTGAAALLLFGLALLLLPPLAGLGAAGAAAWAGAATGLVAGSAAASVLRRRGGI